MTHEDALTESLHCILHNSQGWAESLLCPYQSLLSCKVLTKLSGLQELSSFYRFTQGNIDILIPQTVDQGDQHGYNNGIKYRWNFPLIYGVGW